MSQPMMAIITFKSGTVRHYTLSKSDAGERSVLILTNRTLLILAEHGQSNTSLEDVVKIEFGRGPKP